MRAERFTGDPDEWNEFVAAHGCVYQSFGFGEVLTDGLGQTIVRLAARAGNELRGVVSVAVLKSPLFGRFAVSLPVSDHSGLCSAEPEATAALCAELGRVAEGQGLAHVELRHLEGQSHLPDLPCSEQKLTLVKTLPADRDALWASYKSKLRNRVNKGERAGLQYQRGGAELLDAFYPVYARNLRDLGTPCYPKQLFQAYLRHFPADVEVHCAARAGESPIAVGFTFADGPLQQLPFSASLREHRALYPNMFLYWNMQAEAVERGASGFDFGRSTRDSGTHHFKLQWEPVERSLPWHYHLSPGAGLPELGVHSPRFQLAMAAWKRLPVAVTSWLGPRIVRHLP